MEVEEEQAELAVASACPEVAGVDGDARRTTAAVGRSGGGREREEQGGKGVGEVVGTVACVFDLQGGPRRRAAGEATAAAAWAQRRWRHGASASCRHCAPFGIFRKGPENSGRAGIDPEKSKTFRTTSFPPKQLVFIWAFQLP